MIVVFCVFAISAESSPKVYFPSLRNGSVLPLDKNMGQTVNASSSENHAFLNEALGKAFDLQWCEQYLSSETKKALTSLYSGLLSSILPSQNKVFSGFFENGDHSVSISVRFEDGKIVTFTVKDNRILAITY